MGAQRRPRCTPQETAGKRLVRILVEGCDSPADALELYYWTKEPGLLEIIRGVAMMNDETRAAIEAFVALACDKRGVVGTFDARGFLTLISADAAKAISLAQRAADDETSTDARLLN
jgi:hypothetical protein